MLNAIKSQFALASSLDSKGLVVRPVHGSILDDLVKASCTDDALFVRTAGGFGFDASLAASNTLAQNCVTGRVVHEDLMNEAADKLTQLVCGYLEQARTQVVPFVTEVVERIQAPLAAAARCSTLDLEVAVMSLPAPYNVPSLVEEVEYAQSLTPLHTPVGVGFPLITDEAVAFDMILTGQVQLDEAVAAMIGDLGTQRFLSIVNILFGRSAEGSLTTYLQSAPEVAIIAYLIARKHWDNPVDDIDLPARTYEQRMITVRDQAALAINGNLYLANRDAKAGVLVRSYTNQRIEVNKDVYLPWLESGGAPEVLFGAVISGNPEMRSDLLSAKAGEYQDAWKSHCAINAVTEANNREAAAKSVVRNEMIDQLAAAPTDLVAVNERVDVLAAFDRELELTTAEEMQDPYNWIMRLVTKSLFAQTDAFDLLSSMHQVRRSNPTLSVEEAATAAGAQYVAQWLSGHFTVDNA